MSDRTYAQAVAETQTTANPAVFTVRLGDELRAPETDDEPWDARLDETWEVDWLRVAALAAVVVVSLGLWATVAWVVARVLDG